MNRATIGAEPDLATLRAESACRRLAHEFLALVDSGQASAAVELFTEDGELIADGQTIAGRAALTAFFQAREANTARKTLHVATPVSFELVSENEAIQESLLQIYLTDNWAGDGGKTELLTRMIDRLHRDMNGQWRFRSRTSVMIAGHR